MMINNNVIMTLDVLFYFFIFRYCTSKKHFRVKIRKLGFIVVYLFYKKSHINYRIKLEYQYKRSSNSIS